MSLPFPTRKAGIIEKICYAEHEWQQLAKALSNSYKFEGELPRFVSQKAETILANATECLDHLGKDLIECHLLPTLEESFIEAYRKGNIKDKFPLYPDQLKSGKNCAYYRFKQVNRQIFDEIEKLVLDIEGKKNLMKTSYNTKYFRVIRTMVNEKKHSQVLEYYIAQNEKIFVEGKSGSYLFEKDFRNDNPDFQIILPKDSLPRKVGAYKFSHMNLEVSHLCMFAYHATAIIMDVFYDKFFAPTEKVHKLEQPLITISLSNFLGFDPSNIIKLP